MRRCTFWRLLKIFTPSTWLFRSPDIFPELQYRGERKMSRKSIVQFLDGHNNGEDLRWISVNWKGDHLGKEGGGDKLMLERILLVSPPPSCCSAQSGACQCRLFPDKGPRYWIFCSVGLTQNTECWRWDLPGSNWEDWEYSAEPRPPQPRPVSICLI